MDTSRLRTISNYCPTSLHPTWMYATRWMAEIMLSVSPVTHTETSHHIIVTSNRIFTWHRIFTNNTVTTPPTIPINTRSLVHLVEWCPSVWPKIASGWTHMGMQHCEAISYIKPTDSRASLTSSWSSHARRHLKISERAHFSYQIGSINDYRNAIDQSQIPKRLHNVFIDEVERHNTAHPETLEVLVAYTPDKKIAACFVAGYIEETKQTYYISGYFCEEYKKSHPMMGLIAWWHERAYARGMTTCNWGHITSARPVPFLESGIGYSLFKTHFNTRRVWWPGSFWKIFFT